mgnify:FL=1
MIKSIQEKIEEQGKKKKISPTSRLKYTFTFPEKKRERKNVGQKKHKF